VRAQLGRYVEAVHDLLGGIGPDGRIRTGECTVLEDRVVEEVGRGHRRLDAPIGESLLQVAENLVALGGGGIERDQVIVVELEAVAVALGQAANALQRR